VLIGIMFLVAGVPNFLLVFAGIWALFHGVGDPIKAFQIRKLRDFA
jgi:hypothetical protein